MERARLKTSVSIVFGLLFAVSMLWAGARPQAQRAKAASQDLTALKSVGSRQAPVTIEVFSDYQCPQCRVFYEETTRQILNNYASTGKVYFIHRDFPLNMHSHSREAARWANAAALAGCFDVAEQALYAKQDDWGSTGRIEDTLANALSAADMKKVRLIESSQGAEIDASIARDMALGESRHVDGTPTIYVSHNGQTTPLPPGGVNYSLFKQYLDYLLQQH